MNFSNFGKGIASALLLTGLTVTGCYDDSALKGQLEAYGNRLDQLETLTQKQNTEIMYLKTIADALEANDYVTKIEPIKKNDAIIGYSLVFKKSGKVEIFNGKDGAPGLPGKVPQIGVKKDTDGNYYWTLDGEWLLDSGKKIPTSGKQGATGQTGAAGQDGVTPKLKIENGMWYISYTNGLTWETEPLGPATGGVAGQGGDSLFSNVTYDENFVYLVLAKDNTILKLPRHKDGQSSTTDAVTVTLGETTINSVVFNGTINAKPEELDYIKVTIRYSQADKFSAVDESLPCVVFNKKDFGAGKNFTITIPGLTSGVEYKYCVIVQNRDKIVHGDVMSFKTASINCNLNFKNEKVTPIDICEFITPSEFVYNLEILKTGDPVGADASITALSQQEIDIAFGKGYTALPQDAWNIVTSSIHFAEADQSRNFEIKFVSAKVKEYFGNGINNKYCIAFVLDSHNALVDAAKNTILLEVTAIAPIEKIALTKDMLYSTHGHSVEGADLGTLVDDKPETFWHADYDNKVQCAEGLGFEVDLSSFSKMFHSFKIGYHTRMEYSINPSKIVLYGSSNNGTDWFEIGTLTMSGNGLPSDDNKDYESMTIFSAQGFNRLKYAVPESYNKHKDQLKHPGSGDWGTYVIADFRLWAK